MSNLITRAITGAAYVTLTFLAAYAGTFTTMLLFLPVCLVSAWELQRLQWRNEEAPSPFWSVALAGVAYVTFALGIFDERWTMEYVAAMMFLMFFLSITWLLFRGPVKPFRQVGNDLMIVVLVALPFALLCHMRDVDTWLLLGFMIMLWSNDTGAYIVGKLIGRTKLLPAVSPGKTVEGFLGGMVLTIGVAYLLAHYHPFMQQAHWIGCGVLVALTSSIGDLLESAFKRQAGVKDSGILLPGHGGILDRFDGLLLAAPAMVAYLNLIR